MIDLSKLATFKNDRLSVSRLKLYEQCPRQFFHKYVDREHKDDIDVYEKGEPAEFGTVLHAALELIYQWIVAEEYSGRFPEGQLIVFYREVWQASKLVGTGLYKEGLDLLRAFARDTPLVDHMNILAVEQEFNIDIDGFNMNGFIDRVDKLDDETIEIVDYKSARLMFTKSDLDTDLQMSVYGKAARVLYPWAKYARFTFRMLRHGLDQRTTRTAKTIDDAAGYVVALGKRTETDTVWEAKLNENCAYCDFRRRCEKYKLAVAGQLEITRAESSDGLAEIAREREIVAIVAKTAYGRRDELDKILKAALAESDRDFLDAGDRRYQFIDQKTSIITDPFDAIATLEEAGVPRAVIVAEALMLDQKKVEELRTGLLELQSREQQDLTRVKLNSVTARVPYSNRWDSKPIRKEKKAENAK